MFDATNHALSALQPATAAVLNAAAPVRAVVHDASKRSAAAKRPAKSAAKTRRGTPRRG
jgi:hypothetical protein